MLQAVGEAGIDWMHACGGKGRCTTCMMQVIAGAEQLGPYTAGELRMQKAERLPPGYRLACQCTLEGDVEVRIPDVNKLPHMQYSD